MLDYIFFAMFFLIASSRSSISFLVIWLGRGGLRSGQWASTSRGRREHTIDNFVHKI